MRWQFAPLALLLASCGVVFGVPDHQVAAHLDPGDIACADGFADCNEDLDDGCETFLADDQNCGACGNVCTSAACIDERCEPEVLYRFPDVTQGYCEFVPFTIAGDTIYFSPDGGIYSLPVEADPDAKPTLVVPTPDFNCTNSIAVSGDHLVWAAASTVETSDLSGANHRVLSSGEDFSCSYADVIQTDGVNAYWVWTKNSTSGACDGVKYEIHSAALDGSTTTPAVLASTTYAAQSLELVGTSLVWLEFSDLRIEDLTTGDETNILPAMPGETVFVVANDGGRLCGVAEDQSSTFIECGSIGDAKLATELTDDDPTFSGISSGLAASGGTYLLGDGLNDNIRAFSSSGSFGNVPSSGEVSAIALHGNDAYWATSSGIFRWRGAIPKK